MDSDDDMRRLKRKSPNRLSPRGELNINEFELPSVESLNRLSKVQVVDFALQHTTPELLLSCLEKNVKDDPSAKKAFEDINESLLRAPPYTAKLPKAPSTPQSLDLDMEGLTLDEIAPRPAAKPAAKPAPKPAPKPAAKPAAKIKCGGVKKDGKPCSNNALPGSKRCKIHASQPVEEAKPLRSTPDGAIGAVAGGGQIFTQPTVQALPKDSPPLRLEALYKEKVGEKKRLTTALMSEKDEDIKTIYKEELASLKIAIADIAEELKKRGTNPNLLAFGKNKFASTTNNIKMPPGPAISSRMYGIQMAPPQHVDSNQMVWPVNMPLGSYYEPNLRNVMRDYPGPTGGRSPTLPPQSAAKMESQFRAAQSRISFGRKRRCVPFANSKAVYGGASGTEGTFGAKRRRPKASTEAEKRLRSKRRSAKRKRPAKGRTRRQFHSITVFNGRLVGRSRRLSKKR